MLGALAQRGAGGGRAGQVERAAFEDELALLAGRLDPTFDEVHIG